MSQNIVTLNLTDAQLTAVDAALDELETQLAGLIALSSAQKQSLRRMGPKSEGFCRAMLHALDLNPQIVPPGVGLADANAKLETLDVLRQRLMRLSQLGVRAEDTQTALGSDIMSAALQGYNLLKRFGRFTGLESLRRELGERFAKQGRRIAEQPAPESQAEQLPQAA